MLSVICSSLLSGICNYMYDLVTLMPVEFHIYNNATMIYEYIHLHNRKKYLNMSCKCICV